jgi:tetratricopeptide (TPR) repeat protein
LAHSLKKSRKLPPLDADTLATFLQRATDLHGKGRFDEATRLYEHVELRNPDELAAPYFLAVIDIETGQLARALDRFRLVMRKDPRSFEAAFALAFTFGELGEWELAADGFRRAAALRPTSTGARFALAHALEVTGKVDDAIAQYRTLAELPLVRLRALIGIAYLRPAALAAPEVEELAAAGCDEATDIALRVGLLFAYGRILESAKRYDEAFPVFVEANKLRRGHIAVSADEPAPIAIRPAQSRASADHPEKVAKKHEVLIAARKAAFTHEFIVENSGGGHASRAPIFIVGMPRSGSTLIEQILSSHAQVEGLGEVPTLMRVIQAEALSAPIAGNGLDPDRFRRLADDYLAAQRAYGWKKSTCFVDKMLANYLNLGMIHLMFPNATILHSVRDPVDTCLACFRQLFRSGNETTYDLRDLGAQYVRYRDMMAHWEAVLPPGRVVTVVYEELVKEPDRMIRWLVEEACRLKWDENCLRFYATKRPVRTASVAQVRLPIFTTSRERWRSYAHHLGPLFEAMGPYAPKLR